MKIGLMLTDIKIKILQGQFSLLLGNALQGFAKQSDFKMGARWVLHYEFLQGCVQQGFLL